jgi:membrane protein
MENAFRSIYNIARTAFWSWSDHRAIRIGAGLSYYWLFAVVPLATLDLQLAAVFFSSGDIARWILKIVNVAVLDPGSIEARVFVEDLVNSVQGVTVSIVTVVVAAVSASFAFAATQDVINTVWDVPKLRGFAITLRRRILLLIAAVGVAGLLIVMLLTIAIVGAVDDILPGPLGDQALGIVGVVALYVIAFGVFAMSFRYMPRPEVPWRPVLIASVITVLSLALATFGYSVYLDVTRKATLASAAGSVLATLMWLYVLAQVYVADGVLTRAIHEHELNTATDDSPTPTRWDA